MILEKYIKDLYLVFDNTEYGEDYYSLSRKENLKICEEFERWVKFLNIVYPESLSTVSIRTKLIIEFSNVIIVEKEYIKKEELIDISWKIYKEIRKERKND